MGIAESKALSSFFSTISKDITRKGELKEKEESDIRKAIADIYADKIKKGQLEREVTTELPARPDLSLLLAQRMERETPMTQIVPRETPMQPSTVEYSPTIQERQPLTVEEQISVLRDIYRDKPISSDIREKPGTIPEGQEIAGYYKDSTPKYEKIKPPSQADVLSRIKKEQAIAKRTREIAIKLAKEDELNIKMVGFSDRKKQREASIIAEGLKDWVVPEKYIQKYLKRAGKIAVGKIEEGDIEEKVQTDKRSRAIKHLKDRGKERTEKSIKYIMDNLEEVENGN